MDSGGAAVSAPSSPVPGGVAVSARYSPDSARATATTYKATLAMFEGNLATQTDALQPESCEEELKKITQRGYLLMNKYTQDWYASVFINKLNSILNS